MPASPESVLRKFCAICECPVPEKSKRIRGPASKYCSYKCAQIAHNLDQRASRARLEKRSGRKRCPTCGQLEPINRQTRLPVVE